MARSAEYDARIKDESDRSSALRGLAEHLPAELWQEVLSMTREIKDEYFPLFCAE